MGGFQPWHWLIIAVVAALLFFGWKQLPDMARSVGRSLRVFKTEIKGMTDDDKSREAHDADKSDEQDARPRQLESRPEPAQREQQPQAQKAPPRADVVRNPAAPTAAPTAASGSRPRPTPSPNGRPRA